MYPSTSERSAADHVARMRGFDIRRTASRRAHERRLAEIQASSRVRQAAIRERYAYRGRTDAA